MCRYQFLKNCLDRRCDDAEGEEKTNEYLSSVVAWLSGTVVVMSLVSINEVNLR